MVTVWVNSGHLLSIVYCLCAESGACVDSDLEDVVTATGENVASGGLMMVTSCRDQMLDGTMSRGNHCELFPLEDPCNIVMLSFFVDTSQYLVSLGPERVINTSNHEFAQSDHFLPKSL